MANRHHPKDSNPGYRTQKGATNGPYAWGNGPQPKGRCACREAIPAFRRRKIRLGLRLLRIGVRARLGFM